MNLTAFTTIAQNSLKTISLLTYAQILIALGQHEEAKIQYEKAFKLSEIINGPNSKHTMKIKELKDNPPRNVFDLRKLYGY